MLKCSGFCDYRELMRGIPVTDEDGNRIGESKVSRLVYILFGLQCNILQFHVNYFPAMVLFAMLVNNELQLFINLFYLLFL